MLYRTGAQRAPRVPHSAMLLRVAATRRAAAAAAASAPRRAASASAAPLLWASDTSPPHAPQLVHPPPPPEPRFSVAPMMDWTDVHFRHLCRLLTRRAVLYTEMVVDSTVNNCSQARAACGQRAGPAAQRLRATQRRAVRFRSAFALRR